jgi:alpha-1,3-rhamnosyl/mannosyltransferase
MPSPLRIILNDRVMWRPATGIGHYITELLGELPAQDADLEVLPACGMLLGRWWNRRSRASRPAESGVVQAGGSGNRGHARRVPAWARDGILRAYASAFRVVGRMAGCRVYHEPNHIAMPWPGPVLTTIHDLSALRHPEWHPADRVAWYRREFNAGLARTSHFVAVSQFTRQEMVDLLGMPAERITVVPLAARRIFHPRPAEEVAAFLDRGGWPRDYVLFVGTMEPRKNFERALAAYAALPSGLRERFGLVVVGCTGWGEQDAVGWAARLGVSRHVRFAGYIDDETLAWLYAGARVLLWPSLYEGFGLPVLECMASGTPVISSRTSAIPEVVGEAGVLVDPLEQGQITETLRSVLEDDRLAADLAAKGLARSSLFSWSRCAAQHAQLYRQLGEQTR